jgi:hypothetical protein
LTVEQKRITGLFVSKTYSNDVLPYVTLSRARRAEEQDQADTAAQVAGGRCLCGCGLPAQVEGRHATCHVKHKKSVKNAFAGLG